MVQRPGPVGGSGNSGPRSGRVAASAAQERGGSVTSTDAVLTRRGKEDFPGDSQELSPMSFQHKNHDQSSLNTHSLPQSSQQPCELATIIISILKLRKIKHRKVGGLAQGHTAGAIMNTSVRTQTF